MAPLKFWIALLSVLVALSLSTTAASTSANLEHDVYDDKTELEGIKLSQLSPTELEDLLDTLDLRDVADLDILHGKREVEARSKGGRDLRKRWGPLLYRAFTAARSLFRTSRATHVTRSGRRVTRHYERSGDFNTAVRDFHRFKPDNVERLNKSQFEGWTGTVGKHRITARSGSKQGSPTLDIQSPRSDGSKFYRKFRYD